ncbi:MAG: hypothetical protein U0559_01420 [Anaerolineae bacterium]
MLYARIVRSLHPHALIKLINVEKAEEITWREGHRYRRRVPWLDGLIHCRSLDLCARERVRYIGDPGRGVAAISEEIAEKRFVCSIEVEYEVLPLVLDPEYGASPEAPLLHPDLGTYEAPNFIFPQPGTNVSNHADSQGRC